MDKFEPAGLSSSSRNTPWSMVFLTHFSNQDIPTCLVVPRVLCLYVGVSRVAYSFSYCILSADHLGIKDMVNA